jgi:hypothetical protein
MSDHEEFEPSYGLPECLPAGERMLWQGSPRWQTMARDALHVRALALYFAAMLVWRAADLASSGVATLDIAKSVGALGALALTALATLAFIAWLIERTTVYTVTDQRVVMRIGVVLSVTFNLPYRQIESAGLRVNADGSGDIPLQLSGSDRIAFVHLWPHVRPWQVKRTQPMLRAVPDARRIAALLSAALADSAGLQRPSLVPAAQPDRQAANGQQQPLAA